MMESILVLVVIVLAAVLLAKDQHAHGVLWVLRVIVLMIGKVFIAFWHLAQQMAPK
jgi:C4-dicarboxylate transporter